MDIFERILKASELYDDNRVGLDNGGPVSKFYSTKAAEARSKKASKKLKDFVEKFKKENKGELPTQQQIMKAVGGKSETVQKYLTEGVDYATRLSKQEAAKLAGLKSGEVRAVPEGQDPSYVKRAKTIKESEKFQSKQDKADLEEIKKGKKEINTYFKNNPDAINNTEFGKNIKAMMAMRMDKQGNFYSRVMSDEYYKKKAKEGKIYDLFDIKPVVEGGRNLRYPVNVNITPGQFNSAFIQAQVSKAFSKGVNPDSVGFLDDYLKQKNIRVKLPEVGYVGAEPDVAVTGKPGERTFPRITKTLESMKAPPEILDIFRKYAAIGCPGKAKGGRVDFNIGGSAQCITRGLEKVRSGTNLSPGDKANIKALTNKNPKALTSAARTLSSLGLGTEAALGGFFALTDYATGANKQEIFSNLTYGLAGKDMQEQLKQQDPMYGKADQLDKIFSGYLTGIDRPKGLRPGKITTETDVSKAMQPFTRVNPQTATGDFFDFDKFQTQMQKDRAAEEAFAKEKIERALERGFYDPGIGGSQRISEFAAADGGIAGLSGGAKSGPPPESGKTPHGLLSIKNNVKKY
jgi:hypothetical protein